MSQPVGAAAVHLRDQGRSRARSLTWWAAAGATGMTVIGAAIAASTVPGRSLDQSQASAPQSSSNGDDTSGDTGGTSDSGGSVFQANPPPQVQPPGRGSPFAVSGGS